MTKQQIVKKVLAELKAKGLLNEGAIKKYIAKKKLKEGFPKEDYFSNDVEGAAYFERMRSQEQNDENDKPSASEFYDDDDYDENEEPDCNCSDRDCPCGGSK